MKLALWVLSIKGSVKLQFSKNKSKGRFTKINTGQGLDVIEECVLNAISNEQKDIDFKDFMTSESIRKEVKDTFLSLYPDLERSKYYLSESKISHLKGIRKGIIGVLLLLAGIKIVVALSTGHSNIILLIIMGIAGVFVMNSLIKKRPLDEAKSLITDLRAQASKEESLDSMSIDKIKYLMSLNGFDILKNTKYSDYFALLTNSNSKSRKGGNIGCMSYCYIGCGCSVFSMSNYDACSSCSSGSSDSGCSSCSSCGGCGD
jgi:hypothetical protein